MHFFSDGDDAFDLYYIFIERSESMGVNNRIDVRIGEENKPPEVQKSALDIYQTCTNIENVYLSSSSSDTYWGLSATCDSLSRIEIQATCANANRSIKTFVVISWFNAAN